MARATCGGVTMFEKEAEERVRELEKENAELKEQVENRNCSNCR